MYKYRYIDILNNQKYIELHYELFLLFCSLKINKQVKLKKILKFCFNKYTNTIIIIKYKYK
jgi:hypothetical protein